MMCCIADSDSGFFGARRWRVLLLATLAMGLPSVVGAQEVAPPAVSASVPVPNSYKLGPGDKLRVEVFREEDLVREVRVEANGTIAFPLVGEIHVAGLSVRELEETVAGRLRGRFFKNPKVIATVLEYRLFYIQGEVERPGGYPYLPGLTVRKAVSLAGGLKERASQRKIYVIREHDSTSTPVHVDMDTPVAPGDIVNIEQTFF